MRVKRSSAYIIANWVGGIGCIAFILGLYLAGGAADTMAPWDEIAGPFVAGVGIFLFGGLLVWISTIITGMAKK